MKARISYSTLKRTIEASKGFILNDRSRKPYQYIRVEFNHAISQATFIAIDGFKLSVERASCIEIDEDFVAYIKPFIPPARSGDTVQIESKGKTVYMSSGGYTTGIQQPEDPHFMDWEKVIDDLEKKPTKFEIAFNGDVLFDVLKSAKVSAGGSFKRPVVLKFKSPLDPVQIKTNGSDVKIALPVRMKGDDLQ